MSTHDVLDVARVTAAPSPGPALEAALAAMTPTGARVPARQLAVVGLVLGVTAGLAVLGLRVRADLGELPAAYVALVALAWGLSSIGLAAAVLVPAPGQALPRVRLVAALTLGTSVGLVVLGVVLHPRGAHSVSLGSDLLAGHACAEVGLGLAVLPVVATTWLLRRAVPVGDRWLAAGIGASGGSLGGLVLHLHCAVVDPLHLGVMHGGVVVVAALLAAALAAPVLRPTR